MIKTGNYTYQEITSQAEAWAQALDVVRSKQDEINRLWRENPDFQVLFTGCGSTYYLSLAAATLFQQMTGYPAWGIPGGELLLYPETAYGAGTATLLIAISRSGTTTETVTSVQNFKQTGRGAVLAITNYGDSDLARLGDITIVIPAGQEESVAQTRSFASMYIASTAIAALCAGRPDLLSAMEKLPELGEKLIQEYDGLARKFGENLNLDRFYFLGSGPRYGLACETNLKMKEMTLTHSEPFHFFEFRHGPMSMVSGKAGVIGMRSSEKKPVKNKPSWMTCEI